MQIVHANEEEPFSDEKLWSSKERLVNHYVIQKDLPEDDSWNLLWVVRSKLGETPEKLSNQKFTSVGEATKVIQNYINQKKDTANVQ